MTDERHIDRTGWPPGPWDDEPDRVEGRDGDFTWLALRHERNGHWCGYVGVLEGHPWYGKGMCDSPVDEIEVHGGPTFGSACMEDDRPLVERVCHVPEPGEGPRWWIGFDYHHSFDYAPGFEVGMMTALGDDYRALTEPLGPWQHYRTLGYVLDDIHGAVEQARAAVQ